MSKNKVKLLTIDSQGDIVKHIDYITLQVQGSGSSKQLVLSIKEIGIAPHHYPLSASSYVAFKNSSEVATDGYTYFWNLDSSALSTAHVTTAFTWPSQMRNDLSFGGSTHTDWFTLNIIGSDDLRIGLVAVGSSLLKDAEIGFKLPSAGAENAVTVACWYPEK